jgi:hypothetical protein
MLRKHLGDDVFWGGVADYLRDNMGKTVETEDFRRALELNPNLDAVREALRRASIAAEGDRT